MRVHLLNGLIRELTVFFRNRIMGGIYIQYYILKYKKIYSHVKFFEYIRYLIYELKRYLE